MVLSDRGCKLFQPGIRLGALNQDFSKICLTAKPPSGIKDHSLFYHSSVRPALLTDWRVLGTAAEQRWDKHLTPSLWGAKAPVCVSV